MKIDFSAKVLDFEGGPVKSSTEEKAEDLTLRLACVRALVIPYEDERNLSAEDKFKRGELAAKIYAANEPTELKVEDVATLKKLIGKAFSPLIIYRIWPLLDAAENPKEDKTKK